MDFKDKWTKASTAKVKTEMERIKREADDMAKQLAADAADAIALHQKKSDAEVARAKEGFQEDLKAERAASRGSDYYSQ